MIGNIAPIHRTEMNSESASGLPTVEGESLPKRLSVLVVDQVEETGQVLRAALGDRVHVYSAGKARQGLEMAREHRPDLIVLDLELASQGKSADAFRSQTPEVDTPVVLLGTARRNEPHDRQEFMAKPYHYGNLVRKIEELLKRAG